MSYRPEFVLLIVRNPVHHKRNKHVVEEEQNHRREVVAQRRLENRVVVEGALDRHEKRT